MHAVSHKKDNLCSNMENLHLSAGTDCERSLFQRFLLEVGCYSAIQSFIHSFTEAHISEHLLCAWLPTVNVHTQLAGSSLPFRIGSTGSYEAWCGKSQSPSTVPGALHQVLGSLPSRHFHPNRGQYSLLVMQPWSALPAPKKVWNVWKPFLFLFPLMSNIQVHNIP